MEKFTFDTQIGQSVEKKLVMDGVAKGTFLVFPQIPFPDRAKMIQATINSIVSDEDYTPYHEHFALNFQLIRYYTDIEFPAAELEKLEDETDEAFKMRKAGVEITIAQQFIQRTNVVNTLQALIPDYEDIVSEVKAGIEFAKKRLARKSVWDDAGAKFANLLQALTDLVEASDLGSLISSLGVDLSALTQAAANLGEAAEAVDSAE